MYSPFKKIIKFLGGRKRHGLNPQHRLQVMTTNSCGWAVSGNPCASPLSLLFGWLLWVWGIMWLPVGGPGHSRRKGT